MAVTAVNKIDTWVEPNSEGHRVYKQIWEVITNDKDDGPVTVSGATGLPDGGDTYSWGNDTDPWAFCDPIPGIKRRSVDKSRKVWRLTYTFTTQPRERCQTAEIEDPTAEPWDVTGDCQEWTENATQDIIGNWISNSALQPIHGKETEVFRSRRGLTLQKNLGTLDQDLIDAVQGSVNSTAVTLLGKIYGPRKLYMRKITFTRKRYGVCNYYYPHVFVIDTNADTFDLQVPDLGTMEYVGGEAGDRGDPRNYEDIKQEDDNPVRTKLKLDGNGNVLEGSATESTVFLTFRVYKEYDWTTLGFPTSV